MTDQEQIISTIYEALMKLKGCTPSTKKSAEQFSSDFDNLKTSLNESLNKFGDSLKDHVKEYNNLACEKEETAKQLEEMKNQKNELQNKYDKLDEEHSELNNNFNNLSAGKERLQKDFDALKIEKEKLETEKCELNKKISEAETTNSKLNEKYDGLEKEHNDLKKKHEDLETECNKVHEDNEGLNKILNKFADLENTISTFESLPEDVKSGLTGIINNSMPETIILSATSPSKIQNFYEKVQKDYIKSQNEEILKKLATIFDYMLDTMSKISPNYKKITVKAGDQLDDKIHFHIENKEMGEIEAVILNGLMKNEKVEIRALVK